MDVRLDHADNLLITIDGEQTVVRRGQTVTLTQEEWDALDEGQQSFFTNIDAASGFSHGAKALQNVALEIPYAGVGTPLTFNVNVYDPDDAMDIVTGIYTCPFDGSYDVIPTAGFNPGIGSRELWTRLNGVDIPASWTNTSGEAAPYAVLVMPLFLPNLSAGDEIQVIVKQDEVPPGTLDIYEATLSVAWRGPSA